MGLRFTFLGFTCKKKYYRLKKKIHICIPAGQQVSSLFCSEKKSNWFLLEMWLNVLHLCCNHWTKRLRPSPSTKEQTLASLDIRSDGLRPLYKLISKSTFLPPSASYLQQFMFCNRSLWVTFRVAAPWGSADALEDRNNILCVCMSCFQTVAYLISCCVWLTSYLNWELFGLLNAPQLSSKNPKCELCDFSINNTVWNVCRVKE